MVNDNEIYCLTAVNEDYDDDIKALDSKMQ